MDQIGVGIVSTAAECPNMMFTDPQAAVAHLRMLFGLITPEQYAQVIAEVFGSDNFSLALQVAETCVKALTGQGS
jgi:hypothetical protein